MPTRRGAQSTQTGADSGSGRFEAAEQFLSGLFGGVADLSGLLVWTVRRGAKLSHWPGSIDAAAALAAGADRETNVYVGCGWRHAPLGSHARGSASDIAGISALWLDLDVAGPGHGTKAYPPSMADARALVAALPLPPSVVVATGGGLHLWWHLREPWEFTSESDRASAADLVRDWESTCRHYASERGWTIDSVHDLPRVLRIPGTWRTKPDCEPVVVEVESSTGRTYSPDDFRDRLVVIPARGRQTAAPVVGHIVLRADAAPPQGKLDLLASIEPLFARSMAGKRPDLKDQSASAYDMSVATYAAQAGWTDQEIADLVIHRRRQSGQDVAKAMRLDYITDRISHARAGSVPVAQIDRTATVAEMTAAADRGSGPTELLAYLSDSLGLDVRRWTQTTRHEAFYELHIGGADPRVVVVGSVANVTSQKRFADAVYAHTGKLIGPFKGPEWAQILRALGRVVEVVESGSASRLGQLAEWIDQYTADAPDGADYETLRQNRPFRRDNMLHIHLGDLVRWVTIRQQVKPQKTEILASLRLLGFNSGHVGARSETGDNCTRHYWIAREPIAPTADSVFTVSIDSTQQMKTTFSQ